MQQTLEQFKVEKSERLKLLAYQAGRLARYTIAAQKAGTLDARKAYRATFMMTRLCIEMYHTSVQPFPKYDRGGPVGTIAGRHWGFPTPEPGGPLFNFDPAKHTAAELSDNEVMINGKVYQVESGRVVGLDLPNPFKMLSDEQTTTKTAGNTKGGANA